MEQINAILKQGSAGSGTAELCRQHRITEPTNYRWKAKYGGMESGDAKKVKHLKEENRNLKHVVAELALDNRALEDMLAKNSSACGTSGNRRAMVETAFSTTKRKLSARAPGRCLLTQPRACCSASLTISVVGTESGFSNSGIGSDTYPSGQFPSPSCSWLRPRCTHRSRRSQ